MPMIPSALALAGLLMRAVLGAAVVVALVVLFWKLGRLIDAYAEKLKAKT